MMLRNRLPRRPQLLLLRHLGQDLAVRKKMPSSSPEVRVPPHVSTHWTQWRSTSPAPTPPALSHHSQPRSKCTPRTASSSVVGSRAGEEPSPAILSTLTP